MSMDLDTQHFGEPEEPGVPGSAARRALNSADFERIEAAVRHLIPATRAARKKWNPEGLASFERTLNKIERINKTGEFTPR